VAAKARWYFWQILDLDICTGMVKTLWGILGRNNEEPECSILGLQIQFSN
jgi:hypothetical protein